MPVSNPYIIYLDQLKPDDVGDDEGFLGVDIRWMVTNHTFTAPVPHSTLFHVIFPKGAYHGPHLHTETDEVLYIVRGRAIQWVNGEWCDLVAGAGQYIPKNTIHWMKNFWDNEVEVIGFYPDVANYADSNQILLPEAEWMKYGFNRKLEFSPEMEAG